MHHARQGCKPQSVESCEPHSQTRAGLAVQGDSLAPVSYQTRERGRKTKDPARRQYLLEGTEAESC